MPIWRAGRLPAGLLSAGLLLAACAGDAQGAAAGEVRRFGGPTMGSGYEVQFVDPRPIEELRRIVERELAAFDLAFSSWRDDSEIVRVNAHRSTEPLPVSARFAAVLQQALDVAAATDGAYDPTVAPLSGMYRALKEGPDPALSDTWKDELQQLVDHTRVRVVDGAVVKARPDVTLDLDGIVAGAAADAIGRRLREAGVSSFFLAITGEVLCHGEKPGGAPWRVGVTDPAADLAGQERGVVALPLRDRALCTSGDYRNAVVVDGEVVHHVFDPRTGRNPEHRVVSASAIAGSCAVADAVGTALMVMGEAQARARWPALRALGVEAALLLAVGEGAGDYHKVEIEWPKDDS